MGFNVSRDNNGQFYTCATENGTCECNGTVTYGRHLFVNSIDEIKRTGHKIKQVNGKFECNNDFFGDPDPN